MGEIQSLESMDKKQARRFRPEPPWIAVSTSVILAVVALMALALFLFRPFSDDQAASPAPIPCAPLAVVCGPAEVFPPGGGAGIVFGHAVYNNCHMASIQIGIECNLAYRSSKEYLDQPPADPTIEIDGHVYGKCRLDDGNPDFSVPELDTRIHCIPVPPYK